MVCVSRAGGGWCVGGLFVFRCGVGVCDAGVVTPPPLEKCFFGFHLTRAVSREPCGFLGVLGPVFPDLQLKKFLTRFMALLPHAPRSGGTKTSLRVVRSESRGGPVGGPPEQSKSKRSKLKLLHADIRNPLSGVPFSVRGKPLTRGTTARPHRRAVVFVISVRYGRLRCPSSHAVSSVFEKARSRGLLVYIDQRVSRGCVIHAGSSCVDTRRERTGLARSLVNIRFEKR